MDEYKIRLLQEYQQHYDKIKIGALATTLVQRVHFRAIHVYLRILDYYNNIDTEKYDIEIDPIAVENIRLELEKSLFIVNTNYYA